MTNTAARSDADNKRKLDQIVPVYEGLRSRLIRAEADKERGDQDVETSRAEVTQFFGTDDPAAIDKQIADQRAGITSEVDDFEAKVNEASRRLAALDESAR